MELTASWLPVMMTGHINFNLDTPQDKIICDHVKRIKSADARFEMSGTTHLQYT